MSTPREDAITQSGLRETTYSAFYVATCVSRPTTCWAGRGSKNEAVVTAEACAHTLETGHETAVKTEQSRHYTLSPESEGHD